MALKQLLEVLYLGLSAEVLGVKDSCLKSEFSDNIKTGIFPACTNRFPEDSEVLEVFNCTCGTFVGSECSYCNSERLSWQLGIRSGPKPKVPISQRKMISFSR